MISAFKVITLIGAVACSFVNGEDFRIPLRTLVLITEGEEAAVYPEWVLNSMQVPFDTISTVQDKQPSGKNIKSILYGDDGLPKYNSIVLESPNLGYIAPDNSFLSALQPSDWDEITNYCRNYAVRKVILSSNPSVDDALIPVPGLEKGSGEDAIISFTQDTNARWILSNVRHTAQIITSKPNEFQSLNYYYYPATVNKTDSFHITPFAYITPRDKAGCSRSISLANAELSGTEVDNYCKKFIGGMVMDKNGVEEMHFLINNNIFGHHGFVFGDIWFTWANRGLWTGMRRVPLNTQVDDVFLSTGVYNATLNRQALGGEPTYRITAKDLKALANWQDKLNDLLPYASRFVVEMGFNGAGHQEFGEGENNVNSALVDFRDHFFWVSHTWRHLDMYCPFSDCEKYGNTKYDDMLFEIERNQWFAETELFYDVEDLTKWGTWSGKSIITPRISGLNHTDAIRAMVDSGLTNAVGDNSRADLIPEYPWHGFDSKVKTLEGKSVFVIPRYATRIYFDVSTPKQSEMEHNSIYGPNCYGNERTVPPSYPYKCSQGTFKYPRDLTIDEILDVESFEVVRNLLGYRTDPYMFHQANLRFFTYEGREQSLLTMWVDAVLKYHQKYSEMPIISMKQDDLHQFYLEREERDNCDLYTRIAFENGKPVKLLVKAGETGCIAKVTRTLQSGVIFKDAGAEEHYGPDRTIDVYLKPWELKVIRLDDDSKPQPAERPPLQYPPAQKPDNGFDRRGNKDLSAFTRTYVGDIFKLEKELKEELGSDHSYVPKFDAMLRGSTCRKAGAPDVLEMFNNFDAVTKPTAEAADVRSWFLKMETKLKEQADKIKSEATNLNKEQQAQVAKDVDSEARSSQSKLENWATAYNKNLYKKLNAISNDYSKKPLC